MTADEKNNMALWDSVATTDPAHTKGFSKGGGFKGTSPNATYQAMRATKRWGPCGLGWGVEKVEESLMEGHTLKCGDKCIIHRVYVRLWYKEGGVVGEVYAFGQTTFVGENKYGSFTDEDAPKKSMTDAMTKALSKLGFSADIFLGQYDDQKYVSRVRQEFADERAQDRAAAEAEEPKAQVPFPPTPLDVAKKELLHAVMDACKTDAAGAGALIVAKVKEMFKGKVKTLYTIEQVNAVCAALVQEPEPEPEPEEAEPDPAY